MSSNDIKYHINIILHVCLIYNFMQVCLAGISMTANIKEKTLIWNNIPISNDHPGFCYVCYSWLGQSSCSFDPIISIMDI